MFDNGDGNSTWSADSGSYVSAQSFRLQVSSHMCPCLFLSSTFHGNTWTFLCLQLKWHSCLQLPVIIFSICFLLKIPRLAAFSRGKDQLYFFNLISVYQCYPSISLGFTTTSYGIKNSRWDALLSGKFSLIEDPGAGDYLHYRFTLKEALSSHWCNYT